MSINRNKQFIGHLLHTKQQLEATDEQMAKHLRMDLDQYQAIESGAKVLTLAGRKRIIKRIEGLMKRCGISTEQRKQ